MPGIIPGTREKPRCPGTPQNPGASQCLGTSLMPGLIPGTREHPPVPRHTPKPRHIPDARACPNTQAHPQRLGTSPTPGHIPPPCSPPHSPRVPQPALLLPMPAAAPNPSPRGAPTSGRVSPWGPCPGPGVPWGDGTPAPATKPADTHFLRGARARLLVMHTRHSPAANERHCLPGQGPPCAPKAGPRPATRHHGRRPLPSLPPLALAWEDEDEGGADAPDELDDLANVGDEQGDGERGGHPGDGHGHPAVTLARLRRGHGPALGGHPQVPHHRPAGWAGGDGTPPSRAGRGSGAPARPSPAQQHHDGVDGDDGDAEEQAGNDDERVVPRVGHQDIGRHGLAEGQVAVEPCGREERVGGHAAEEDEGATEEDPLG